MVALGWMFREARIGATWQLLFASVAKKEWPNLAFALVCLASLPASAATPGSTNEAALAYVTPTFMVEPPEQSDILLRRFLDEVIASDSIVFDRFTGPASRL